VERKVATVLFADLVLDWHVAEATTYI